MKWVSKRCLDYMVLPFNFMYNWILFMICKIWKICEKHDFFIFFFSQNNLKSTFSMTPTLIFPVYTHNYFPWKLSVLNRFKTEFGAVLIFKIFPNVFLSIADISREQNFSLISTLFFQLRHIFFCNFHLVFWFALLALCFKLFMLNLEVCRMVQIWLKIGFSWCKSMALV